MREYTETIRLELEQKSSDELISILRNRDEEEWNPQVFDVVARLLRDRGISPEEVTAMGPEGYDAVESAPTVTVARFLLHGLAEAHALRMALEEAGIPAWVADETRGSGLVAAARLQVRAADEEAARQILETAAVVPESGEEE